ncbi:MAG: glycosyltransferase [Patescibacteria group bacterium]|jgi:glycosyltransferase involved in cell wall biosynthesis
MTKFLKNHKIPLIIFFVALIFRLFIFGALLINYGPGSFYLDDGQGLNDNDAQYYVLIAKNLVEHQAYSSFIDPPFQPTAYRTPLMPFYFVPFIYLFGFGSIWLGVLILDIILSLTPVIAYFLAKLFLAKRSAVMVGLLVALEPALALCTNDVRPDALLVLLFLLTLYHLILFWQQGKRKNLCYSAIFLGLAALAKPIAVYLLFPFIVFILLRLFFEKIKLKKLVISIGLLVVIFIALVFPWLLRNYLVFGSWDFASVVSHGLYGYYTNDFKLANEPEIQYSPQDRDPTQSLKYQKQKLDIALARIKAQPVAYFKSHLLGTARYFFASDLPLFYYSGHQKLLPFKYNPVNDVNVTTEVLSGNYKNVLSFIFNPKNFVYLLRHILFALFYLVIFLALLKSFLKDKRVFIIFSLFLALTFYFLFGSGPYVDPTYRIPVIPLLLIIFFYNFEKQKITWDQKNLIIASGTFSPEVSGQSTFVFNLVKFLPADLQVKVISYGNDQSHDNIFLVKKDFFRHLRYWWQLKKIAKRQSIIYAQDLFSSGLPASLAKGKNKLIIRIGGDFLWEKMVNSGKCSVPLSQYYQQPKSLKERLYLLIYKLILSRCDRIIFNSDWQRNLYLAVFKINRAKTALITNSLVNPSATKQINNNYPTDSVVYAGRFIPLKNLPRLIKAYKKLKTQKKLLLIGSGPQRTQLQELAKDDQRIEIISSLDQPELRQLILNSYLVVIPSLSEVNPNLALECLALKKPVLLTKENGFAPALKNIFISIDPLSEDDIYQKMEFLLQEENYQNYLNKLSAADFKRDFSDVVKEHLEIFKSL